MRKYYLDNIRWVTVLMVAIYHVFFIFNSVIPDMGMPFHEKQYQDIILYILYPWFMILLFIVSGMSARYYLEKHSLKDFVRSRTRKLLVPSTIGLFAVGWIQGYISMLISGAFETMHNAVPDVVMYFILVLSGTGVLWFVQLLWLFSMVLVIVRHFERGKIYAMTEKTGMMGIIFLVVPLWLSGLILNLPVITVYRFGIYSAAFFLGYFLFAHDAVIERISRWRYAFIAAAVILGAVYVFLHFGENYAAMPVMGSFSAMCFAWTAILAIFGSAKAWMDRTSALSEFMRKKSWGIYIFHYPAMSATAYLLRQYTAFRELPCYLLSGAAAIFGSLIVHEIIARAPFFRWCMLGIGRGDSRV